MRRARAAARGRLPARPRRQRAAGLFAGEAKTDERDAAVIARTALGVPDSLSGSWAAARPSRPLAPSRRSATTSSPARPGTRTACARCCSSPARPSRPRSTCRTGGGWSCSPGSAGVGIACLGPRARGPRPLGGCGRLHRALPALVEAENRQVRFLAARISEEALGEAGALEAETAALLEGDETLRVPAHRARHRPEDRGAARGVGRHREVPGPRPPGLVLRHSPEGEELRHVGEVGQGVQARRREAQVPADLLVQQPGEVLGALRRVLPGLQGAGHGASAGAQGRREGSGPGRYTP